MQKSNMSDEEIEEFSISDRDLRSAFNPTGRRGRQSKEEAIYGIWASKTETATRAGFGGSMSRNHDRPSRPVSFISGGVKHGSKIEKKQPSSSQTTTTTTTGTKKKPILIESYESDEDSDEQEDEDDDDFIDEKKRRKKRKLVGESSEDDSDGKEQKDDEVNPIGSSDEEIEAPIIQRQPPKVDYRRPPPVNTAPVRDKDFGTFEKHTKGIGMKLLMKMGFEKGRGLGKNLQGRALPVQVVKRQGKGAVGSYGQEDPNRESSVVSDDSGPGGSTKASKQTAASKVPQWKKQPREKAPPKQQYVYRTLNDVLKEQTSKFHGKKPGQQTCEKIIDMTGREQRVLQNYDSLSSKHHYGSATNEIEPIFSLHELTHNLDLVIESSEEAMIRSHRRRKFDEDTTVALKYESENTQQMIHDEETNINRLHILLNMIEQCEQHLGGIQHVSELFFLQTIFDELQRNYEKEYQKYRLWDLAVPVLHTRLKQYLALNWHLLTGDHDHDRELIDLFAKWRIVLEDDTIDLTTNSSIPSMQNMDAYHRLLWDVWMPFVRKAILEWNPREPDRLIDLLDRWIPCLPLWIIDNILDQLILPILQREVDAWNPLTDSIPIHSWLHPWLPLMEARLEPLYQPIRTKLAQALQNWEPSDSSAKAVLLPWKGVFKQGTWDAFMNKYIVPKLVTTMQQFIVDPRQQVLDPWNWIMAWHDMIPLGSMIAILEKSFFPKWLQVLNAWLNTNPNYQEIQRWYSGWRSLLPPSLISHITIKEKLTEGLMMIDRRLSGPANVQPPPPPPPSQPPINVNYEAIYNRGVASSSSTVISSFKDLVERKAAEHNLLFLPVTNRMYEGKQVYRFGNANIYIDKNVLFLFENGQWMPIQLNRLVSKAA